MLAGSRLYDCRFIEFQLKFVWFQFTAPKQSWNQSNLKFINNRQFIKLIFISVNCNCTVIILKIHAGIHSIKFRNQFSIPQLKLIAGTEFDELNLFPALNLLSLLPLHFGIINSKFNSISVSINWMSSVWLINRKWNKLNLN